LSKFLQANDSLIRFRWKQAMSEGLGTAADG